MKFRLSIQAALSSATVTAATTRSDGDRDCKDSSSSSSSNAAGDRKLLEEYIREESAAEYSRKNAFVPRKLEPVSALHGFPNPKFDFMDDDEGGLFTPFSPWETTLTNDKMNAESSIDRHEDNVFGTSAELGILDNPNAGVASVEEPSFSAFVASLNCNKFHPVDPSTNFQEEVERCLLRDTSTCQIECWDTSEVTDMSHAFDAIGTFNADISEWDTSSVTDMKYLFSNATQFNQPIGNWDTSRVTNMDYMFQGAKEFNQTIGDWDTSSVESMKGIFSQATKFNQNINNWKTSNVKNMNRAFFGAYAFNSPIGLWDTSSVTTMERMFVAAFNFDQPIDSWDTSSVTKMSRMFALAKKFNQDIGDWSTASSKDMSRMFTRAYYFNQGLNSWNTSGVLNMNDMFRLADEFDQPIGDWDTSNVQNMRKMFHNASSFNQELDKWQTSRVTDMYSMFYGASKFNTPIGEWNTLAVTNMKQMFYNASEFNQCLEEWKRTGIEVTDIFKGTQCPYTEDPTDEIFHWCQSADQFENPNAESELCQNDPDECSVLIAKPRIEQLVMCNRDIYAEKCPATCAFECTCENEIETFTSNTGSITSCAETAALNTSDERVERCKDPEVLRNCPGICDTDLCPCSNHPGTFIVGTSQLHSCKRLSTLNNRRRRRRCRKQIFKENCPGLCDRDKCPCENNRETFKLSGRVRTSCASLKRKPPRRQRKICKRAKVSFNCPGVCSIECNSEQSFAPIVIY